MLLPEVSDEGLVPVVTSPRVHREFKVLPVRKFCRDTPHRVPPIAKFRSATETLPYDAFSIGFISSLSSTKLMICTVWERPCWTQPILLSTGRR